MRWVRLWAKKRNGTLKTLKDIKYKPHAIGNGIQGTCFFENGYGISLVRFKLIYPDEMLRVLKILPDDPYTLHNRYGSYTSSETEWELAVLEGSEDSWDITYKTPIARDVLGHLTILDVHRTMEDVQLLRSTRAAREEKKERKAKAQEAASGSKQLNPY